jgi:hypothetical protein
MPINAADGTISLKAPALWRIRDGCTLNLSPPAGRGQKAAPYIAS